MTETKKRGRKLLPESKKKKPVIVYLSDEQIDKLGGALATRNILTDYSLQKIKQYEKKIVHHP
jgi:hypothetical protein